MITISYMGYSCEHKSDFSFEPPIDDCYLLLLVTTPARFLVDGVLNEYPANTAILYAPGQKIYYEACAEKYVNDWMRFSSDESFVSNFTLTGRPFSVADTEYCHNLFKLIAWESSFSGVDSEVIITNLLQTLFLKLQREASKNYTNSRSTELILLRKKIFNNPQLDWNVDKIAEQLHISTGHLQLIYKKNFGVTCMDDIIAGRIQMAKERLLYSSNTILEISEKCGYHNVEHFCRQFKKHTGCSPSDFRKKRIDS